MNQNNKMNLLLRRIANTIIANASTSNPGKLEVCLFLYKYAEYSNNPIYEQLPRTLLKEIFKDLEERINMVGHCNFAEIGIGLIRLIDSGFVLDSDDSAILMQLDKLLLEQELNKTFACNKEADNTYSVMLYIYYRFVVYPRGLRPEHYELVINQVMRYVQDRDHIMLNKKQIFIEILYVCVLLENRNEYKDPRISEIITKIMAGICKEDLRVLLKYPVIKHCCLRVYQISPKVLSEFETLLNESCRKDLWYQEAWISDLYGSNIYSSILPHYIEELETYIYDSYYDSVLVGLKLSGIGLNILFNKYIYQKNHEKIQFK